MRKDPSDGYTDTHTKVSADDGQTSFSPTLRLPSCSQDALRGIAALVLSDAEVLPDDEVGVGVSIGIGGEAADEAASLARAASPIRSRPGSPTRHLHLRTRSDSPGRYELAGGMKEEGEGGKRVSGDEDGTGREEGDGGMRNE